MRRKWLWLSALMLGLLLALPSMAMTDPPPVDPVSVVQASDSDPPDLGVIGDHVSVMPVFQMRTKNDSTITPGGDPVAQVIKTGTWDEMFQITPTGLSQLRFENSTRARSPILTAMGVDGFGQCTKPGHNHLSHNTG